MKLNESTIRIDVNSLKNHLAERGIDYSINQIKDDLKSLNAVVRAEKTEDGDLYMVVGGDIDMDRLESVFDECMVDVNKFIIDDISNIENYGVDFDEVEDEINECDGSAVVESAGIDFPSFEDVEINEKKKDCCPKKKVNESKTTSIASLSKKHYSKKMNESKTGTPISSLGKKFYHKTEQPNQHLIPLKEALSGKEIKLQKNPDVNEIIDSLTGKKNSRRINEAALAKARSESKKSINENYEFLSKKLGDDLAGRIWKALSEKKTSLYEKVKINGKAVSEFTLEELQQVYEKVCKKVDELESTSKTEGLNETDATNAEKKLALNTRLKNILTEEIEFRNALKEADDNSAESFLDQFNLDPNAESATDDNNDDNSGEENAGDENNDDSDKSDDDNNNNPDNDQVEEIGSIVITMASEKAANDLKDELVQEGVPEDVIEIEAVEDEEEENNEENNSEENTSSEENGENNSEENNGEENNNEQPNESKSSKVNGKKLNEDDENNGGDNGDDNAQNDDENGDDSGSDKNSDSEEKQYKVILTDTDYAEQLQTVMADYYGIEKDEFEQMIGGTIVDDDNDSDDKNEKSSDENKEDADGDNSGESGSDGDNNDSADDEIDPETVFKGL